MWMQLWLLLLLCFVIGTDVGHIFATRSRKKRNMISIDNVRWKHHLRQSRQVTCHSWLKNHTMTYIWIMSRFYNKLAAGARSDFDLLFSEIDDFVFFLHWTLFSRFWLKKKCQDWSLSKSFRKKKFIGQLYTSFPAICASFYEALQTETDG